MGKPSVLPTGIVTFLFTDIEGSTPLWETMPAEMQTAVKLHHTLLRQTIEANGGQVFQIVGDAFQAAFRLANEGLQAAIDAQRTLKDARWGATIALRVRMGLHTGPAEIDPISGPGGASEYISNHTLNRASRVMSAGHGGQILLSQEAADLVMRSLTDGVSLLDLGEHRLKGMQRPEHLYQVMAPDLPQQFPPLPTAIICPNNLPVQLTSFIGREKEIAEIEQALQTNRLVTLTGSGGTGKTRLALEVAARELEDFPDGAWLVELAPITDPELVAVTILGAFGLGEHPGQTAHQIIKNFLCAKTLLIVLDNCEHLIDTCARLANELLKAAPKVHLLATSREALGVSGELAWRVPSLDLPDPKMLPDIRQLHQCEAVRLFVERAGLVQPKFALQPENAQAIAQVCQRLDGIPLAIELASSRVKVLSPSQIAAKLDDRFRLLSGGSRTALPRQQTLRALIDWSYALLTDSERLLFCRLAVFSGGWTLEEVEQVCADERLEVCEILDLLSRLVDKSLVNVNQDEMETRYRMLETIRQYARQKMFDSGEAEVLRDRHLACFMALAEKAEPEVRGHDQLTWLNRLAADLDNLRSALEWAQNRNSESFLRLASALWRFWDLRGLILEGSAWLLKALDLNQNLHSTLRVKALARASGLLRNLSDADRAVQLAQNAISLGEELQDKSALAQAYDSLHSAACLTGQKTLILTSQENGLALSRELGDHWLISQILSEYYTDPYDIEQTLATGEESIKEARLAGDQRLLGFCLANASYVAVIRGDLDKAHDYILESISVAAKLGDPWTLSARIGNLAIWALFVDDYTQARNFYTQSLQIIKNVGAPFVIVETLLFSAQVDWATEDIDLFSAKIQEAEDISSQREIPSFLAYFLHWSQGMSNLLHGKLESAEKCFRETLALSKMSTSYIPCDSLEGLAYVANEKGQLERAVRLFVAEEKIRNLTGWQNFTFRKRIIRRYLDRALEQLGAEAYASNWEQGISMSKEETYAYALSESG